MSGERSLTGHFRPVYRCKRYQALPRRDWKTPAASAYSRLVATLLCRCKIRFSDNQFNSLSILLGYMSGIRPMGEAGAALWACATG
jgi:hypothetical protein